MLEYWTSELEEYLSSFGDVIGSMNGRQFVSSLSDETGQVQGYRKIVLTLSDDGNAFTGTIDEDHLGVYEYHCTVSGTRWNPDSESDETDPPSPTPTPQAMPVPTLDCRVTCCPGIWLTAEEVDAWQHIQAGDSGYSCLRCAFAAVDTVYAFDDGGCGWDKDRGPDNWEKYEACLAMCGQSPAEPTPTGCFLELEVDPQSVSAGEVAYLSLRASRGAGEPIVGQLAQVAIQEGPGDILESPLATNEDGEVLFIYQAPADIIAQTTVQLIATVAGCPDDAATASLSLQAAAGLEVEVSPPTMNEIGDVVTVTVSVITPQGSPLVGETVTLALLEPEEEPIAAQTDADGIAFFTITHVYPEARLYRLSVRAVGQERIVEIPVLAEEVQIEQNPETGKPYIGVVADGKSTLKITLNLPQLAGQTVEFASPELGTLKGKAVLEMWGQIQLDDQGHAEVTYRPPDYLTDKNLLTEQVDVHTYEDAAPAWGAPDVITFSYKLPDQSTRDIPLKILVFRPPVMLVHGFIGSKQTWATFASHLADKGFDPVLKDYAGTPESYIRDLSEILQSAIAEQKRDYAQHNIKLSKVDIVAHSMGGLISRYYVEEAPYYGQDVRKLIMAGTPNHGVVWWKYLGGEALSILNKFKHWNAAVNVYAPSIFLRQLNKGESTGAHLNPDVEYANLIGRRYAMDQYIAQGLPYADDDGLITMASSHLNGVIDYAFEGHCHSVDMFWLTAIDNKPLAESPQVWDRIERLLLHEIYRPPLQYSRMEIHHGEGEVSIRPASDDQWTPIDSYPMPIRPWYYVRTGNGRAIIYLYLNEVKWGTVNVRANTELVFDYASPELVRVLLKRGSAHFRSLRRDQPGHFDVYMGEEGKSWYDFRPHARVLGLETEFAIQAGPPTQVYVIEGRAVIEGVSADGQQTIVSLSSQSGATVETDGTVTDLPTAPDPWWEAPFYQAEEAGASTPVEGSGGQPGPEQGSGIAGPSTTTATAYTSLAQFLLCGSLSGLVMVIAGAIAVVVLARRRSVPRWVPILLGVAAMILLLLACGAGFMLAPTAQTPLPTSTPVPAPSATPTPTAAPPTSTPLPTPPVTPTAPSPAPPTATPTEVSAPPTIGPITFAEGITGDDQPINPGVTFTEGITKVFALAEYANMSPEVTFGYAWVVNGEVEIEDSGPWAEDVNGVYWDAISMELETPLTPGTYELRLYLDGELVQAASFTIEPAASVTPSPSPTAAPQAGTVTLTLINALDQEVCYVFISPPESETWGDDWLGPDETVPPGATRTFAVTPGTYDLAVFGCDEEVITETYEVDITQDIEWRIAP